MKDNIYLNTFVTNSSEELTFPTDEHLIKGSIKVTKGISMIG
jgi:hypothetical protein